MVISKDIFIIHYIRIVLIIHFIIPFRKTLTFSNRMPNVVFDVNSMCVAEFDYLG